MKVKMYLKQPFDFKRYLEGGCEPYDDHDDGDTGEKR